MPRQPALRHRHADARRTALAERPGRRLDARGQVIFGMARALAVDLTEALDVLERDRGLAETLIFCIDRLHAGEMQHRIEQHRCVPVRQHEAVAIGPDRILRIEAQEMLPQRVDHRRQGHRRPGVAGERLLHGIHRQGADRVDAQLVHRTLDPHLLAGLVGACVAQDGILRPGDPLRRPRRRSSFGKRGSCFDVIMIRHASSLGGGPWTKRPQRQATCVSGPRGQSSNHTRTHRN